MIDEIEGEEDDNRALSSDDVNDECRVDLAENIR